MIKKLYVVLLVLLTAASSAFSQAKSTADTLRLSHLPNQIAHFVAIEFGDQRNSEDVLDEVFRRTQECLERRLARAATDRMGVRRDDQFDQPWRRK